MKNDTLVILNTIAQSIFDKKGINILALDVRDISTITDFVIIAEGNVDRHVVAIAQNIQNDLKLLGEKSIYVEGLEYGDWVVLDYLNVMVHLFMPGMRDKYQLEKLWGEGKIVDLNIVVSQNLSY
ncbi:MAG: ribosome silencing factor [Chlamydiota bacterium]